MTQGRDFKRWIRARAAKTGESYQTARRQLAGNNRCDGLPPMPGGPLSVADERLVNEYFDGWLGHLEAWRAIGGAWHPFDAPVPVAAMQAAAVSHPNARVRHECLSVLDHAANDQSVEVFRSALRDLVPRVRIIALHGLSCDRCRVEPLRVDDVLADLEQVVIHDPSAKVRHAAVLNLARLITGSDRVQFLLSQVAQSDPDELVRQVAASAANGNRHGVRSRKALRRRRTRGNSTIMPPQKLRTHHLPLRYCRPQP